MIDLIEERRIFIELVEKTNIDNKNFSIIYRDLIQWIYSDIQNHKKNAIIDFLMAHHMYELCFYILLLCKISKKSKYYVLNELLKKGNFFIKNKIYNSIDELSLDKKFKTKIFLSKIR